MIRLITFTALVGEIYERVNLGSVKLSKNLEVQLFQVKWHRQNNWAKKIWTEQKLSIGHDRNNWTRVRIARTAQHKRDRTARDDSGERTARTGKKDRTARKGQPEDDSKDDWDRKTVVRHTTVQKNHGRTAGTDS